MRTTRQLLTAAAAAVILGSPGSVVPAAQAAEPSQHGDLEPRIVTLHPRIVNLEPKKEHHTYTVGSDVLFAFDSDELGPDAADILRTVVRGLKDARAKRVTITGYTDSIGSNAYNEDLSERRARTVRDYLKKKVGKPDLHYTSTGKGENDPVAANTKANGDDNPAGRQKNRRVTITYQKG